MFVAPMNENADTDVHTMPHWRIEHGVENLHGEVDGSLMHNHQKVEVAKMPFHG